MVPTYFLSLRSPRPLFHSLSTQAIAPAVTPLALKTCLIVENHISCQCWHLAFSMLRLPDPSVLCYCASVTPGLLSKFGFIFLSFLDLNLTRRKLQLSFLFHSLFCIGALPFGNHWFSSGVKSEQEIDKRSRVPVKGREVNRPVLHLDFSMASNT